jgi:hypothetical protein
VKQDCLFPVRIRSMYVLFNTVMSYTLMIAILLCFDYHSVQSTVDLNANFIISTLNY